MVCFVGHRWKLPLVARHSGLRHSALNCQSAILDSKVVVSLRWNTEAETPLLVRQGRRITWRVKVPLWQGVACQ